MGEMIATLQMYDLPEVREATEAFWTALAAQAGMEMPLSRPADHMAPWRNPDLLWSQTCGYPLTHEFRGQLTLVATPHYKADGCDGPRYCSILVARERLALEGFRGTRAAFNNRDSMSGMLALKLLFAPLAEGGRFFASATETGSHMASLAAVQEGAADVAAIDCVTLAYARHYRPKALTGLVEIARSPQVPGLPYITRAGDPQHMRQALAAVCADPATKATRAALLLDGFSVFTQQDYAVIPRLEAEMEAKGGLTLW